MQCQDVIAFLQYRVGFINTENYDIVSLTFNSYLCVSDISCFSSKWRHTALLCEVGEREI